MTLISYNSNDNVVTNITTGLMCDLIATFVVFSSYYLPSGYKGCVI